MTIVTNLELQVKNVIFFSKIIDFGTDRKKYTVE